MRVARLTGLVTLLLAACGGGERAEPKPARSTASPPPDSLALTLPGGAEIWFTGSRTATGADGTRCVERVMEIREGGSKRMIPLLYTGTLPTRVNDTTIEAAIWLDCRPGNVYQVNIRTGQPVRVK